jgi:hypothetical protein
MLQYQTRVSFQETPNGVLTTFTTADTFAVDSLTIAQGALLWTDYTYTDNQTVEFGTAPLAPADAGALVILSGLFGTGATGETFGLWDVVQLQVEYDLTLTDTNVVAPALVRADARVQRYITAAIYADATLATPTDALRAIEIKYAIGDLTKLYLSQNGVISGGLAKYTERYAGVKTYEKQFSTQTKAIEKLTESDILARLVEWKRADTDDTSFTPCVTWGTGRFVSGTLTITTDDDD